MGMGKRKPVQEGLFVAYNALPRSAGHPFYVKLNEVLEEAAFDRWLEKRCAPYYAQEEKPVECRLSIGRDHAGDGHRYVEWESWSSCLHYHGDGAQRKPEQPVEDVRYRFDQSGDNTRRKLQNVLANSIAGRGIRFDRGGHQAESKSGTPWDNTTNSPSRTVPGGSAARIAISG